jgi:hypothetical protein
VDKALSSFMKDTVGQDSGGEQEFFTGGTALTGEKSA